MRYFYILALIFVHSAVKADQVMFSNGASIVAGDVSLNVGGNYNIDGKVYAAGQVLQWLTDHPITIGPAHGVRFRDGRLYLGILVSADRNSISLRVEPIGEIIVIPRSHISEIMFCRRVEKKANFDFSPVNQSGFLIRNGGEPVPCKLDEIRGSKILFSTKLNKTLLPIDSLICYVIPSRNISKDLDSDLVEVGLTDGSVFRGKVLMENQRLTIQTSDLSPFTVPSNAVHYLRNNQIGEWLPLWESGKNINDGIGEKVKHQSSKILQISAGENVSLPAISKGNVILNAKLSNGLSAKLVISRNGKDLIGIELKKDWQKKYFSIGEGKDISFRVESADPDASAMLGDLVILGGGQG